MKQICATATDCTATLPSGAILAQIQIARSFPARLIGLLGRTDMASDEGLMFVPGGSIHTVGMRFAIDVVFLDEALCVLRIASHARPGRWIFAPRTTRYVLELSSGRARSIGLECGMSVALRDGAEPASC